MGKFVENTYVNGTKHIAKLLGDYTNLAITVSDTGITANGEGKKIVPAGTILGGGFLASETVQAVKTNAAGAEGVLFYDVDVTYGPASGAAMIAGSIDLDKLPEAPDAAAITALKKITFVK